MSWSDKDDNVEDDDEEDREAEEEEQQLLYGDTFDGPCNIDGASEDDKDGISFVVNNDEDNVVIETRAPE